jgi:hypothetical protein
MSHAYLDGAGSLLPKHHILKEIKIITKLSLLELGLSKQCGISQSFLFTFLVHKDMKTMRDGELATFT